MKKRISSSMTKGLVNSYYVYLALITIGLLIHPNWPVIISAVFIYVFVSIWHFSFFRKLSDVHENEEGLIIEKKGKETILHFSEIISIDRPGTWFVPVCIYTTSYESHYFLSADFPMAGNEGIVKDLRKKVESNQSSHTTPASAPR